MPSVQGAISQLETLLSQHATLAEQSQYDDLSDLKSESRVLANKMQAAVERLTTPESAYARQAEKVRFDPTHVRLAELQGVVQALRDDMQFGWLDSIVELVHADTYADFFQMAEGLLQQGYKDAAAVIAGSSLEAHLRSLCIKHQIATQANGKPKKADTLNADLKKAAAYGSLEQKQITSWLDLRNSAAHGDYVNYDSKDVQQFISAIQGFMTKYPA
jgi:hypothetical protein